VHKKLLPAAVIHLQPAFFHFKVACTESMSGTLALTEQLIARASVTPDDQHCQRILIERLTALGFECETIESHGVTSTGVRRRSSRPIATACCTGVARPT
jgi:succinyl-diaminopimelate desuccinylase